VKALIVIAVLAVSVRAHAKGCHEVSNVVGFERCTWFGTWSRDVDVAPFWMDLAFSMHSYTSEPYSLDAAASHGTTRDDLATTAMGPMFRMLYGRLFYTGVDFGGGWISQMPTTLGTTQPTWGSTLEGHVIGGAHVALWRFGIGAEAAFGGRWQVLSSCDQRSDPSCMPAQSSQTSRELSLRAHVDLFLTPRWSIGALLGTDHELMIYTGVHVRAVDGSP
jgi:hypothetical protein